MSNENLLPLQEEIILNRSENHKIAELLLPPKLYVWWIDELGRILKVCDNAATLVGFNSDEIIGGKDAQVYRSKTFETIRELESRVTSGGSPLIDHLVRYIPQSAVPFEKRERFGIFWLVTSMRWSNSESGNVEKGIVRVARDVSSVVSSISNAFDESYSDLLAESTGNSTEVKARQATASEIRYEHDLNGNFIAMNEAGLELLGLSRDSISRCNILDILSHRHYRRLSKSISNGFSDVSPTQPLIWRARKSDGLPVWIEVVAERKVENGNEIIVGKGWPISLPWLSDLHRNNRIIVGGSIAAWDREIPSNRFFVSNEWKEQLGISADEKISYQEFLDRIHPTDLLRVRSALFEHFNGSRDHYECCFRIKHNNGEWKWIKAFGKSSTGLGGTKFISGHNVDVTGEFENAKELNAGRSLFRAIVESDPAMIFLKNKAGEFEFANAALCRFYQTSPEEIVGNTDEWFYRTTPKTDAVNEQLQFFKSVDTRIIHGEDGNSETILEKVIPPNCNEAEARWFSTVKIRVELDGEPFVVGISSDVTRIKLENAMYQSLLEFSPAAMFIKSKNGSYEFVNEKLVKLLGASDKDAVIGAKADDFLSADSSEGCVDSDKRSLAGDGEDSVRKQIELINGTGKYIVSSKRSARILNEKGQFESKLIGCDIDETFTRDQTYIELLDSLLNSLKHDYVCRFLSIIDGELGKKNGDLDLSDKVAKWQKMLKYCQDFINRLEWLVPTAAEHSEATFGNVEEISNINMKQVVSDACELANMLHTYPNCRENQVENAVIKSNATILSNVIFNLLCNSKKFTLGRKKKANDVFVNVRSETRHQRSYVVVEVDDGGEGITMHADPMVLFKKGEAHNPTAELDVKGSGIGLYFSRMIVEQLLGGEFDKPRTSKRGGSVFSFAIPTVFEGEIN